ncbi:hypothetical protein VVMO6_01075 [Vibrio vulnificus MO6-24/O]|nr:hypothetical protein VVMO6_01075 [Vibrio vulnificus MO6-24/O]
MVFSFVGQFSRTCLFITAYSKHCAICFVITNPVLPIYF